MSEENDLFTRQIKTVLDHGNHNLDADTAARLARARRAALAGPARPRRHWHPAANGLAIAAGLLLAVGLWLSRPAPETAPPDMEDLQLLAEKPDLDFYQDLDFYVWLAEQNDEG